MKWIWICGQTAEGTWIPLYTFRPEHRAQAKGTLAMFLAATPEAMYERHHIDFVDYRLDGLPVDEPDDES